MTDRGLITLAIVLSLTIAGVLVATFAPRTRRTFWITGLSFALIVFAGWTIIPLFAIVTHRHLNAKGALILVSNGYVVWMLFKYLIQKIREPKSNYPATQSAQHP